MSKVPLSPRDLFSPSSSSALRGSWLSDEQIFGQIKVALSALTFSFDRRFCVWLALDHLRIEVADNIGLAACNCEGQLWLSQVRSLRRRLARHSRDGSGWQVFQRRQHRLFALK